MHHNLKQICEICNIRLGIAVEVGGVAVRLAKPTVGFIRLY